MAHQIEEYDLTFSTSGGEWHGLAQVAKPSEMMELVRKNLCPPIVVCDAVITHPKTGLQIPLKTTDDNGAESGWHVVCADCTKLPKHKGREVHPPALVPLHTPRTSYNPLENERFLDCLATACDKLGIPFNLATAGTLGNLAYFYFSLEIKGLNLKGGRGETLKPYLSGITSHNGVILPQFKDSFTRPVCMNTVRGVLSEMSELYITGKHTVNGLDSIENMGAAVEAFFTGTARLEKEVFPRMQETGLDAQAQREVIAGYFLLPAIEEAERTKKKIDVDKLKMSTQSRNAMAAIVDLAKSGKGNRGETLYDLWNGATDYWSNGAGVGGETVGLSKRVYRSHFGSAAGHKEAFSAYVFNPERVASGQKLGKRVLKAIALAAGPAN